MQWEAGKDDARPARAGNGSQWPRMAVELVDTSPAFRASIAACAAALQRYDVDLMAEFAKPDGWSTPALAMSGLSAVQARSRGTWWRWWSCTAQVPQKAH